MLSVNMHGLSLLKIKKGKTVLNALIEIINDSNHKLNKLWIDQGREFTINLSKNGLTNDILMCSAHNEGKSVIAKRFIKTLKAKTYTKMKTNDNKFYLSYLNKLVDQYNNTYHHYINKKPINADYSALTEKIETNLKLNEIKLNLK